MAHNSNRRLRFGSQVVAGIGNFAGATVLWVSGVLTVLQGISVLPADQLIMPCRIMCADSTPPLG